MKYALWKLGKHIRNLMFDFKWRAIWYETIEIPCIVMKAIITRWFCIIWKIKCVMHGIKLRTRNNWYRKWWIVKGSSQAVQIAAVVIWKAEVHPCQYIQLFTWWRHQMETFSALLAICAGNSPVTGEFPYRRQATRSFDVFFDLRLKKINGWVNNSGAGDLRRHSTYYDVTLMKCQYHV